MSKLMCYVGLNPTGGSNTEGGIAQTEKPHGGGIAIFEVGEDGHSLSYQGAVAKPVKAGALHFCKSSGILYAVDECKTPGRGDSEKGSNVYAYKVNPKTGILTEINHVPAMGPNPTDLTVDMKRQALYTASHGGFEHVEKLVQDANGHWQISYEYDSAATAMYALNEDGRIGEVLDVKLHSDHGQDPNQSPQHGGHAQSSGHAHCTVIDPSGQFLLVGDKGSDRIYIYRMLEKSLALASIYQFGVYSGARHIAFSPVDPTRMYITLEFSSEVASFDFDPQSGTLKELDRISTVDPTFSGRNEPATLRVHPNGKYIFLNNRGEDTVITVEADANGKLTRRHAFQLGKSVDPGVATRQLELTPDAAYLYVPERPAYQVRVLRVNDDGTLSATSETPIDNPVYVCFAQL